MIIFENCQIIIFSKIARYIYLSIYIRNIYIHYTYIHIYTYILSNSSFINTIVFLYEVNWFFNYILCVLCMNIRTTCTTSGILQLRIIRILLKRCQHRMDREWWCYLLLLRFENRFYTTIIYITLDRYCTRM